MSKTFELNGTGLSVDVGRFAGQAGGSAWLKHGNNVVLSVATAAKDEKDFMGFFPLTVEYREKTSAAGRIPGGYIKREGRLSDNEVLTCRVIDRCVRPFFPSSYFNEVQVMSNVYSADGHYPLNVMAILDHRLRCQYQIFHLMDRLAQYLSAEKKVSGFSTLTVKTMKMSLMYTY